MQAADRVLSALWIAFGLGVAALAPRFGLLDAAGPGGGFVPMLTGVIIAGCGLMLLARPVLSGIQSWPARGVWLRMGMIAAGLAVIAVLMPRLGFILTVIPVMIVLMQAVERQSWVTVLVTSIGSTLAVYFLFTRLLGTTLPRGLLRF